MLNKQLGLPLGTIATLFRERFRLTITAGGLVHAIRRAARRAAPTYTSLRDTVRGSPVVTVDETGWKVNARLEWLWVYATPTTTVYTIQPGRGFDEAAGVLGADFDGILVRDGWAPYRRFAQAIHQTCLAHLLRRCRILIRDHRERRFAPQVQRILQHALQVRDNYQRHDMSAHGVAVARGHLQNQLNALIDRPGTANVARRLAAHLAVEFPSVFTFSSTPTPSMRSTGARNKRFARPSSRERCAAAIDPHAAPRRTRCWPASFERFSSVSSMRARSSRNSFAHQNRSPRSRRNHHQPLDKDILRSLTRSPSRLRSTYASGDECRNGAA